MTDLVRYGYFMHPSTYTPPLGHASMEVFLAASNAERYFDTEALLLSVSDGDKTRQVQFVHPAVPARQTHPAVFGRFYLLAYDGDVVEGMSLGGTLTVEAHDTYTHCQLTSPAPIFDIEENAGLLASLESEIEAELARVRAEWKGSDAAFDRQLASLPPLTLLATSLVLLDSYLHKPTQAIAPDEELAERTAVQRAIRTLQQAGQWPQSVPTLRELMGHG